MTFFNAINAAVTRSKQYASISTRQFFLTHSYVSSVIFKLHEKTFTELSLETTFKKFLESILRWKTTNLPQNSFWTKTKTLQRMICTRHSSQLTTYTYPSLALYYLLTNSKVFLFSLPYETHGNRFIVCY